MASSILGCLNFTWDTPCSNPNKRLPVLDTELWVGEQAREKTIHHKINFEAPKVTRTNWLLEVILFSFYKKPMANRCANLQRAGLPESSKVATATQKILRRLKNVSRELPKSKIESVLQLYMSELKAVPIVINGEKMI